MQYLPPAMEKLVEQFARLPGIGAKSAQRLAFYVGKTLRVLVDGRNDDGKHTLTARTDGGRLVHLDGGEELIGGFYSCRITGSSNWALFGEIVEA